jgi:hypothetical protein
MEILTGTAGMIAGLATAVLIFAGAWLLVARARRANRRVREARGDPHIARVAHPQRDHDQRRDIPQ